MTERPTNVRAVRPEDEDALFDLLCLLYDENAPFKMSEKKVRHMIAGGSRDKEVIIGVIEENGKLVASVGAVFEQWWHTDDWHIGEMWNFVHPDHRKTSYAKDLINYMKWIAETMDMSLHMGIITATKMEAKIRLYRRQMLPVGALFIHNLKSAGGPLAKNAANGELNG